MPTLRNGLTPLSITNPDISKEWDYDRNAPLRPSDVSAGSNRKVWWKCNQNHSYLSTVYHHASQGLGCPYCSGKKVLIGFNDLASCNPLIAEEWDYEKNGDLSPDSVTLGSNKKVWWKCKSCGNSWRTDTNNRNRGRGCPLCAKKKSAQTLAKTLLSSNSKIKLDSYPELSKEWDYNKNSQTPSNTLAGSRSKAWWICSICGNSWLASVSNRVHGSGCPQCKKYSRTSFPEQAIFYYLSKAFINVYNSYTDCFDNKMELDIYVADINTGIEYDGFAFHSSEKAIKEMEKKYNICKEKNIRLIRVSEFDNQTKCFDWCFVRSDNSDSSLSAVITQLIEKISDKQISVDVVRDRPEIMKQYITILHEKSISHRYPDVAKKWDLEKNKGLRPDQVNAYSNKKYWWKCDLGHSYLAAPINEVFNTKSWWKCEKGHEWEAVIGSRSRGNDCPYCSSGGTSKPEQAIAYYLSKVFDVKQRAKIYKQEIDVYLPQYTIGIEYDGKYYHKNRAEKDAYKTALLTQNGVRLIRIVESDHNEYQGNRIFFNSNAYMNNFEWALKTLIDLLSQITGRAIAGDIDVNIKRDSVDIRTRYALIKKQNSIEANYPELAEEWNYDKNANLTPDMFTKGSKESVWWLCKLGHEWQAPIYSRVNGNGCPYCSGRLVSVGKNDLLSVCPELVKEWDYEKNGELLPETVAAGSSKRVWWKCAEGHEWQVAVSHRSAGSKCPYCQNQKVWPGFNDLATKDSVVSAEWDYDKNRGLKDGKGRDISTPDKVTASSKQNVWWKCNKGHSWQAMIYTRTGGCGCPICSHRAERKSSSDF